MFKSINQLQQRWTNKKNQLELTNPKLVTTIHWTETLLGALIIALILRQFIVQSSLVFSGSMIPTLQSATQTQFADRLIVNKLVYLFNNPTRGDIILFDSPYNDGKQYVKRLIGLPGETIEIRRGMVYVNGKLLVFPGITLRRDYSNMEKVIVPKDSYFVLGDNRGNSADSRVWGFVNNSDLIGEAMFIYWPINRIRWVK